MEQLRQIYREYAERIVEVQKKELPLSGMFGTGGVKDHPLHTYFYENVEKWVDTFATSEPAQAQVKAAVWWILSAANEHPGTLYYWFYLVAQNHAKKLIPLLPAGDREELARWYDQAYPVRDRLPAQKEIYTLLAGNAEKPKKKWKFGF